MNTPTSVNPTPAEQGQQGAFAGSALQTAVSQAIKDAIAAHIDEYSKHFPEQAWGKGALHARLLPAVMAVLPNTRHEPRPTE